MLTECSQGVTKAVSVVIQVVLSYVVLQELPGSGPNHWPLFGKRRKLCNLVLLLLDSLMESITIITL